MPEELEIGKILIGVRVVLGNALEALSKAKSTMKDMAQAGTAAQKDVKSVGAAFQSAAQGSKSMNTALAQTEKQLNAVNQKAAETKTTLSGTGAQTENIDKYTVKIENLTAKYESQKQKVAELSAQLDGVVQQYAELEMSAGKSGEIDAAKVNPQLTQRLDTEIAKMDDLKNQIALTQQARDEAANKAALSAQKQADAAEKAAERETQAMAKMEERQKRADSTLALSSMAMMMNTVANASDGLAGKLSTVASQVIFLKQALNAAASPAAKLGTAFAGGLGIAVSVFTALASEAQRLREESIKSAAEAAQAYVSSEKEIKTLEKNISILESYNSTTEEVKKAKQELAEMSPGMIAGYDKEGEAVLKTVDALKKELEYRKLLADEKLDFASKSAETNVQQYYASVKKYEAAMRLMADAYDDYKEFQPGKMESLKRNQDLDAVYGFIESRFTGDIKSQDEIRSKAQEFANSKAKTIETAINSIRARITDLCEGDTTISDAFDDSFFRADLDSEKIDENNIDAYAKYVIDRYDQISAQVDEGLRDKIFDEGTDDRIKAVYDQKIQKMMSLSDEELESATKELESQMQKLMSGNLLDDVDIFKNLEKKAKEGGAAESVTKMYDTYLAKIRQACSDLGVDFVTLTNTANKNSAQLQKAAVKVKAAESTYEDLGKGVSDLVSDYKSLNKEMSDLGALKAVSNALHQGKSAKDYGAALKYVADMYGVTEKEAAGMVDTIDAEISAKEALIVADAMAGQASANFKIAVAEAMCASKQITEEQCNKMTEALAKVAAMYGSLFNGDGTVDIPAPRVKIPRSGGSGKKSGGGGGSKSNQNTALDNELKRLEHKKAMDDLTYSEELAWLQRIRSKYAKTAEEKQELDEKVYSAKKALLEAEREHAKNMDQLTLQEEIASLESQMRLYRSGTQARIELEEQLYQAKKDLERQVYDLNVYYGKLNLEEQAKQIEKMISKYKEGTQARIDLEKELYDIQQQIKERDTESINKVAEGITEALRNRYEQQRDAEQQRIEESKKSWQEWSDAQVKAIQEQMDALDDLTKQEDQAEEERKRRRKISAMEQAIQYESDDYNRRQLAEQLETAKKDLEDYLKKIDRDNQKEALRAEQERIKEQAEKEQELLDEEWKTKSKEYEEFLKEFNLKAEAEKMLMKGNQEEILDIIKSYAPEYDMAGQTLGEKLVDGFSSKVTDIQAWIDSLTEPIREQQRLMAIVATEAADNFMRRQREREAASRAQAEQPRQISLTVNVNKEIATPYELRCELERMIENISDL